MSYKGLKNYFVYDYNEGARDMDFIDFDLSFSGYHSNWNALINTAQKGKIVQRLNTVNVILTLSMSKLAQRLNVRNVTFLMTIVDPLIMLRHNQRVNRGKIAQWLNTVNVILTLSMSKLAQRLM